MKKLFSLCFLCLTFLSNCSDRKFNENLKNQSPKSEMNKSATKYASLVGELLSKVDINDIDGSLTKLKADYNLSEVELKDLRTQYLSGTQATRAGFEKMIDELVLRFEKKEIDLNTLTMNLNQIENQVNQSDLDIQHKERYLAKIGMTQFFSAFIGN
jgi:hypothetical protein